MELNPEGWHLRSQVVAALAQSLRERAEEMELGFLPMESGPVALRAFAAEIEIALAAKERSEILEQ